MRKSSLQSLSSYIQLQEQSGSKSITNNSRYPERVLTTLSHPFLVFSIDSSNPHHCILRHVFNGGRALKQFKKHFEFQENFKVESIYQPLHHKQEYYNLAFQTSQQMKLEEESFVQLLQIKPSNTVGKNLPFLAFKPKSSKSKWRISGILTYGE